MEAQYAYIRDDAERLIGVLRLRDSLLLERSEAVRMAMTPDPQCVRADADDVRVIAILRPASVLWRAGC